MTKLTEMTSREINSIRSPSEDMYIEAADVLLENGWKWIVSQNTPVYIENPYTYGWWVNESHETKNRRVGDPGNFHFKAWDTLRLYVAK